MARLDPLIRLYKHRLEEKQRALSEVYREVEVIENQIKGLENQRKEERQRLNELDLLDAAAQYNRYAAIVQQKIDALNRAKDKLEVRVQAAQEAMRIAFAEMKKVEIVARNRASEEEAKLLKEEMQELDEVGIDMFRRREED